MPPHNRTLLLNLSVSFQGNVSTNSSEIADVPWYFSGEGAMVFSIVTILVYGMSIVCFIMFSMRKHHVDRDEEKQVWKFIKQYGNIRSSALKDEEQRIRAKLLFMSILGNMTPQVSVQTDDRRNGRITKLKDRRVSLRMITHIPKCIYVDSSGNTSPQLINSGSIDAQHKHLITAPDHNKSDAAENSNLDESGSDSGDEERQPLVHQPSHPQNDCFQNVYKKLDCVQNKKSNNFPDSRSLASYSNKLEDLGSLHRLNSDQSDIEEPCEEISQNEMQMIVSRRRKRSGTLAPRHELLKTDMDLNPDRIQMRGVTHGRYIKNGQRQFSHDGNSNPTSVEDLADPTGGSCSRLNIVVTDSKLPLETGSYNISKHNVGPPTSKPHNKVSFETPRPRLAKNRRTQSFRLQNKKQDVKRRGSLEPITAYTEATNTEPMEDSQYILSLACKRRDRRSRISTVCLPHDSDSCSSNDIILPAVTLPPIFQDESSDDNTETSFKETLVTTEISSNWHNAANSKGDVTITPPPPGENAAPCSPEPNKDMVVLLPSVEIDHDTMSSRNISKDDKLKRKRTRRSGVINAQFKRGTLKDQTIP